MERLEHDVVHSGLCREMSRLVGKPCFLYGHRTYMLVTDGVPGHPTIKIYDDKTILNGACHNFQLETLNRIIIAADILQDEYPIQWRILRGDE